VSLLALTFLGVHIATVVIDPYVTINLSDVLLPFGASYRPLWLGLGALAFDLLLAVVVTSLLRVRIGRRAWRMVHWAAYAAWPAAVLHGLGAGTDAHRGWMLALTEVCVLAVGTALVWRTTFRAAGSPRPVVLPPVGGTPAGQVR
jgi:methionine sulfoxide reductase heme-binding subunit